MLSEIVSEARASVNLTEDVDKVKQAVKNVLAFSEVSVESSGGQSVVVARGLGWGQLSRLKDLIRQGGIRDAARRELLYGMSTNKIHFFLNKQVAFASHVSFSRESGESPLGPIDVEITNDNPQAVIDWLAPSSRGQ